MFGGSFRVGRLAGIPIGVHPLWFLIVGLITVSLGATYYPDAVDGIAPAAAYALGLLSALLLFASIVLHELGHSLVARRHGVEIEEIDLWLLGGVARMRGAPREPSDELRFALAGPGVTLGIAILFGLVALALPSGSVPALRALVEYQFTVNVLILGFNLVPAFPLDGGRVARALIWRRTGDLLRATAIAAMIGRGFGYFLVALGLIAAFNGLVAGLWFSLIGFFVITAARAEERQAWMKGAVAGRQAWQLMSAPAVSLPAEITVDDAVRRYFVPHRYTAFPVVDRGDLIGLLSLDRVEAMPESERSVRLVRDLADRDPELLIGRHADAAELLERPAFQRVGRAIVIDSAGDAVGMVSITDVSRALRAARLAGAVAHEP